MIARLSRAYRDIYERRSSPVARILTSFADQGNGSWQVGHGKPTGPGEGENRGWPVGCGGLIMLVHMQGMRH
jgi:hypothetical protein